MTDADIKKLIGESISKGRIDWMSSGVHGTRTMDVWEYMAENIIRAMREAGVLYVEAK